jgi:hypothetical protein
MAFSMSRWRLPHLIGAWVAYWVVLLATVGARFVSPVLHALNGPRGTGTISAGVDNGVVNFAVKSGATAVSGSASFLSIALWIAGPPLLMWALWVATRTRPVARERVY